MGEIFLTIFYSEGLKLSRKGESCKFWVKVVGWRGDFCRGKYFLEFLWLMIYGFAGLVRGFWVKKCLIYFLEFLRLKMV